MPRKESDAMKERMKFALEWASPNVAQLCREFGSARETPTAYDEDIADVIAAMRKMPAAGS